VREPDVVRKGELGAAAAEVKDWASVAQIATRHRVAAYVRAASAREGLTLPAPVVSALQMAERFGMAMVMRLDLELARLVPALAAEGIPTTVLKGPALARTVYPDRALRPYGDIDLTIQEHHQDAAVQLLLDHGHTEVPDAGEDACRLHAARIDVVASLHRQFVSGDGQALVEVHADPLQLGLRPTCEAARWRRAVTVPGLAGALTLCPEDQIVQLSAHVHKHGFERLIWLKDLDAILRTYGDRIDWDLVEEVARTEGVLGSVWYSLHLAQVLLLAPVPWDVQDRLRPSALVRMLYGQIWPAARIADLQGFMRRRAVQFHGAESWRGALPSLVLMGRRADRARATARAWLDPWHGHIGDRSLWLSRH
jgi:hypothetical protein